jgi:hypothetical protein
MITWQTKAEVVGCDMTNEDDVSKIMLCHFILEELNPKMKLHRETKSKIMKLNPKKKFIGKRSNLCVRERDSNIVIVVIVICIS